MTDFLVHDLEARFCQLGADLRDLFKVPRLHANTQEAAGNCHVGVRSFVADADDIGTAGRDNLADAHQLARLILQSNEQVGITTRGDQAAGDDPGEDIDVDIAAGDKAHGLLPRNRQLAEHRSRNTHRTGALGNQLLLFNHGQDRRGNLVLGYRDDAVYILLDHGECRIPRVLDGNAVAFVSERYGMRNHASWGSMDDVFICFLNQDAYDRYRLSPEDYALYKEVEKRQNKDAKSDKKKSDKKDAKSDDDSEETKAIKVEKDGIIDRIVRVTPMSTAIQSMPPM